MKRSMAGAEQGREPMFVQISYIYRSQRERGRGVVKKLALGLQESDGKVRSQQEEHATEAPGEERSRTGRHGGRRFKAPTIIYFSSTSLSV